MDRIKVKAAVAAAVKKYGYALVILLAGILLLMLPKKTASASDTEGISVQQPCILSMEERLSDILSHVSGAGKVRVLLTQAKGEETVYQTDQQATSAENSGSTRMETVTVTGADRTEQALVRQVICATYMGAVIVCEGADDPSVCFAIVSAVSKATGLGADKITVLKTK